MVLGHNLSDGKQRTQDVRISEDISFDTMLLKRSTLKGLRNAGFFKPSPIQLHGIPLGKCGFDLFLEAKSGTGKTAVFTIIALEKLELDKGIQALVLAPTREIASQISDVITEIGSNYIGLKVAVVMGGLPVKEDIEKFEENIHIVVGSPGRLRHLVHDKHINVSSVRLLVLDEADKLMEPDFQRDINYIFSCLPKQKQVIMSSATYPEQTRVFISKYVQKVQHICPDSNNVLLGIEQRVTTVPHHNNIVKQTQHRYEELKKILNEKQFKQCLIFCNYQVRVGELHRMLSRDNWPAEQLYGQQEQTDRLDALKTLQQYKCRILVSTDLAARGIDAQNVDIVINFEPPFNWQTYLHRIGRAGRYGSYGMAISILSEGKEKEKFIKTLGLSKIPFNLQDFWNDEPFDLILNSLGGSFNENKALPPAATIVNEDKKEDLLWKALTSEALDKKDGHNQIIPSFESLCESFNVSSEPVIETFSDLMHSFTEEKNEDIKKVHLEYKQVKVTKLPIENINYWTNLQAKMTNKISNPENGDIPESKTEPRRKIVQGVKTKKNIQDIQTAQEENDENLSNSMVKKEAKILANCDKSRKQNSHQKMQKHPHGSSYGKESVETDIDPTMQAMLDAGLPTAFGKPKDKSNYNRKSYNYYDSNNNNENSKLANHKVKCTPLKSHHNDRKEIVSIKSDKNTYTKQRICLNNYSSNSNDDSDKPDSSSEEESDHTDLSSETSKGKKSLTKSKNSYAKYAFSSFNNSHKPDTCSDGQIKNRCKKFDLWYNQLKCQMRYIQYALYIDEFRKL